MSDAFAADQSGVTVNAKKDAVNVGLSDKSVETIANTIARMWESGLDWSERNPNLFVISVIALLLAFRIWMRERTATRAMKSEYEAARARAKTQLPLPLPEQGNKDTKRKAP